MRAVNEASVFVKVERGHTVHLKLRCGGVINVYVQLHESYPAGVGKSQFIQNRRQPLAVASLWGVKLEQYRAWKAQDLASEHAIRDAKGTVGVKVRQIHAGLALAAGSRLAPSVFRDTVLCAASRAFDDNGLEAHTT